MKRLSLWIAVVVLVFSAAPLPAAWADVYDENDDDAQSGSAVPLQCREHPRLAAEDPARRLPPGSLLCDGFILSKVSGDPSKPATHKFDAALDTSLAVPPGAGPFPLLIQVHGYGGSKGSSTDDYRVLGEGIAFLRYSTRGFGESYGDNQLIDEDFEVRDVQNLVREIVEGTAFATPPPFSINRKKIAITGASYGGGHSLMLAQTDRREWPCAPDTCELVTAIPIVPWTDLIYSLIPNGRPFMRYDEPGYVLGIEKFSYVTALFASGLRTASRYNFSSYPPFFFRYFAFTNTGEPYQDPRNGAFLPHVASTGSEALKVLALDRSPAYQDYCREGPIPIFILQGWTDDLFTAHEVIRLRNILDAQCGREYPLKAYFGNTGHPRALGNDGEEQEFMSLVRDWLGYWLLDRGPEPSFDVISGVTHPPGEKFDPSAVFRVEEFEKMMRGRIRAEFSGPVRITYSPGAPTTNDLQADPITSFAGGDSLSSFGAMADPAIETVGPLTGDAAVFSIPTEELIPRKADSLTVCGTGSVRIAGTVAGADVHYAVRVWDVDRNRKRYLVDRGVYRYLGSPGDLDISIPLHGNAWRLTENHRLVVEITNSDSPYLRPNNLPSSTVITGGILSLPTCERGTVTVEAEGQRARARKSSGPSPTGLGIFGGLLTAALGAVSGRRGPAVRRVRRRARRAGSDRGGFQLQPPGLRPPRRSGRPS